MIKKNKIKQIAAIVIICLLAAGFSGCGSDIQNTVDQVKSVITGNQPLQVESVSEGKYAYETLDDNTKLVYDEIVYTIQNRAENVQIATTDIAEMELAYLAVRYDYCNFFWLDQFSYVTYSRGDEITAIEINPIYTMTAEEQDSVQKQIDAEAERMLSDAPRDGTDYEKALYVYEKLITDVDYVEGSENNQNIISVFLNHETICQGYAYATQYLLGQLGIPCATVVGTAEGENHAWNLVVMDEEYYYIDTTWGNSQYIYRDAGEEETGENKYIDYDYFGASTQVMESTHQADERIVLPECTAVADNYYVHEGRYVSEWDPDVIGKMISEAYDNGDSLIQIKFSDMELYEQALQYFVEEYHLTDYCEGLDTIRYMENADNSVLFLQFPSNES